MGHPVVRELLQLITDSITSLFQWKYSYKHFVITKQIARDFKEYKNPSRLPGHVQLGLRMQKRGIPVGGGTRVEYVILKKGPYRAQDTQTSKIEDVGYFAEFRSILRLSYLDYLHQFINPIDELCHVVMGVEGFVKQQFKIRLQHSRVVDRITELGRPKFEFIEGSKNDALVFED
jgi:DNA polymerase elongation subunit (family B)